MVKVLILGVTLQQKMSETELDLDVPGAMPIKALLASHGDQLGALAPYAERGELIVTVNRKVRSLDSLVKDGDVLKISHQSRASYDGTTDIPT